MHIWRLTKPEHAPGLDGEGARLWGGRWNSPGRAMVYCASSLALAALETLVHLPPPMRRPGALPSLVAVEIDLPDTLAAAHTGLDDPQVAGNRWLAARTSAALIVPSFVIPLEANVLLNPAHPDADFRLIRQVPFVFDDRLAY